MFQNILITMLLIACTAMTTLNFIRGYIGYGIACAFCLLWMMILFVIRLHCQKEEKEEKEELAIAHSFQNPNRRDCVVEKVGKENGHYYVVLIYDSGYRCGYVEHPGKVSDNLHPAIERSVHGGVHFQYKLGDRVWIGFDCAHFGDEPDDWAAYDYFGKSPVPSFFRSEDIGHIWSKKEVENECLKLIKALRKFK